MLSSPSDEKITEIKNEIQQTTDKVHDSINLVIDRGEKLETLVSKSEILNENSKMFNYQAKRLKRKMFLKKMKMICLLALLLIMIFFIFMFSICGFKLERC